MGLIEKVKQTVLLHTKRKDPKWIATHLTATLLLQWSAGMTEVK